MTQHFSEAYREALEDHVERLVNAPADDKHDEDDEHSTSPRDYYTRSGRWYMFG